MLRTILVKIGEGILIGVGVGIAFGAYSYVHTRVMMSQIEAQDDFSLGVFETFGPEAKLVVTSHRPKPGHESSSYIGEIANNGDKAWNYVELVVEHFDKDNVFVGKCSDHLEGTIRPGQKRNFEVSCASCGNEKIPEFDHYTIQIVDANVSQGDE